MINERRLKNAILELLSCRIGFSLEIQGTLYIRELEGDYAVGFDDYEEEWEETFEGVNEAVSFFLSKRNEFKCGEDFSRFNIDVDGQSYEYYCFVEHDPDKVMFILLVDGIKYAVHVECEEDELVRIVAQDKVKVVGWWNPIDEYRVREVVGKFVEIKSRHSLSEDLFFGLNGELKQM